MAFRRAPVAVILIAAWPYGLAAYCQSTPGPHPLLAQPQGGTPAPNTSSQKRSSDAPNNFVDYDHFMEYLGKQDDKRQAELQNGSPQTPEEIDLSSAIGISQRDVDTILSVLLDAYHRRASNAKETEGKRMDAVAKMLQENHDILLNAWRKLKETLPPESYKKLNAYVSSEFGPGPYPSSYRASLKPIPVTPFSREERYEFFIDDIGMEEDSIQRNLEAGSKDVAPSTYSKVANFPPAEEAPVRAILVDAWRQLQDNTRQIGAAEGAMVEKYGEMQAAARMPLPPDVVALGEARRKIVADTIDRLRWELGSEYFANLDAWVNKAYYGSQIINPSTAAQ